MGEFRDNKAHLVGLNRTKIGTTFLQLEKDGKIARREEVKGWDVVPPEIVAK